MKRPHLSNYVFSSLLLSLFSLSAEADVAVGISVAMPMGPPAGVVVAGPPEGYTECYVVPAEWFQDRYFPAHRECVYDTGVVYSPGYWSYYNGAWVWLGGGWGGRHGFYRTGYYNHGYAVHGGYHGTGYANHGYPARGGYVEHGGPGPGYGGHGGYGGHEGHGGRRG